MPAPDWTPAEEVLIEKIFDAAVPHYVQDAQNAIITIRWQKRRASLLQALLEATEANIRPRSSAYLPAGNPGCTDLYGNPVDPKTGMVVTQPIGRGYYDPQSVARRITREKEASEWTMPVDGGYARLRVDAAGVIEYEHSETFDWLPLAVVEDQLPLELRERIHTIAARKADELQAR